MFLPKQEKPQPNFTFMNLIWASGKGRGIILLATVIEAEKEF